MTLENENEWIWMGAQIPSGKPPTTKSGEDAMVLSLAVGGRDSDVLPMLIIKSANSNSNFSATRLSLYSDVGEMQLQLHMRLNLALSDMEEDDGDLFVIPLGNDGIRLLSLMENSDGLHAELDGENCPEILTGLTSTLTFQQDLHDFLRIWLDCGGLLLNLSAVDARFPVRFLPAM